MNEIGLPPSRAAAILRVAATCAIIAVLLGVGALAGLAWTTRPTWWMGVMVAGTELMAALTALLAGVLSRRSPPRSR